MRAATEAAPGVFEPPLRNLSTGLLLSILLIAFESLAVATVLPTTARELRGLALYGWSFSAFFLGYLVSTVTLGGLADRDGPARPYAISLGLFGAGLLVAGSAPSMPAFVLGRALQGLGGGAVGAIAYLVINRAYPEARRARMLALLSSAWVLPALVGPLLAGLVAASFSWRAVFVGILPLLVAVAALTLPALARLPGHGTPFDLVRVGLAVRAAVGAALVLAALQGSPPWAAVGLGVLGLLALLPAVRRLFPPGTFGAAGPLPAGMATRFLLTFSFLGADALVPLALSELRGFSVTAAGLVLTCAALSWSTGAALQARLDERGGQGGRPARVRLGFALVIGSILLVGATALTPLVPPWAAAVAWALGGLGMGLAFPAHTLVVFQHAPDGQEGQVAGSLQMADVLGTALSAGVGGALVATLGTSGGLAGAYGLTVAAAVLGLLVAGRLSPTPPRVPGA